MENLAEIDMDEELFVGPRGDFTANVPPEPREHYLEELRSAGNMPDVVTALMALTDISRIERALKNGRFSRELADQFVNDLRLLVSTRYESLAGSHLVAEGAYCEGVGDYVWAARFYRGAIDFKIDDRKAAYYRFNYLGFCLNYFRQFEEAEKMLQRAIESEPKAYNAWKNLGVTNEHLGRVEIASKCYMHAINYSSGEARCIKHLLRLVARNPGLKRDEYIQNYLESLRKHGKL